MRIVIHLRAAQSDALKQSRNSIPHRSPADDLMDAQRLGHDIAGSHARIERGKRILKDDLHFTPVGPQFRLAQRGDVLSPNPDAPGGLLDYAPHRTSYRPVPPPRFP